MQTGRILRYNPSSTHIKTVKCNPSKVDKKIKSMLMKKVKKYQLHCCPRDVRMGRRRRFYYHDHRFDDPWNFTEKSRIRHDDLLYISQYMHHDPHYVNYINDIKNILTKKSEKLASQSSKEIDPKYFSTKILHEPGYKQKSIPITCHERSTHRVIYYFLYNNLL